MDNTTVALGNCFINLRFAGLVFCCPESVPEFRQITTLLLTIFFITSKMLSKCSNRFPFNLQTFASTEILTNVFNLFSYRFLFYEYFSVTFLIEYSQVQAPLPQPGRLNSLGQLYEAFLVII
jgi:hypothetical protein